MLNTRKCVWLILFKEALKGRRILGGAERPGGRWEALAPHRFFGREIELSTRRLCGGGTQEGGDLDRIWGFGASGVGEAGCCPCLSATALRDAVANF